MPRLSRFLTLLPLALTLITPIRAHSLSSNSDIHVETTAQSRLVVFESFLRSTCMNSRSAGPAVDRLASEYAGQPVVFIEYNVDSPPSTRINRWLAAYNGTSVTLPLVMTDSGHAISYGAVSYYNAYKAMINASLARAPLAEIQAYWQRVGERARVYAQVKNLSGVTLSGGNSAAIHVIVYEDAHVQLTDRFGRAAVSSGISSLAHNAAGAYKLETPDLSGVNWDKLHVIVLVDYLPPGSSGAFDMLQAAQAQQISTLFDAQPGAHTFLVDPADLAIPPLFVAFQGASFANWSLTGSPAWVSVSPGSGPLSTGATVSALKASLASGWQQGVLTFTTPDGLFADTLSLKAYLGPLQRVYLPLARR